MCVAIAQRKNAASLTKEELARGWRKNPDGGGYAFIDRKSGKIMIRKFMTKDPFIKAYLRDHTKHGAYSPFVVHMRIATHGGVAEDTAHPFRIDTKEGETVFAHNGIISEVIPYTDTTTSDTMAFRDLFLDELPDDWLDNQAIRDLVEAFIGWSKMVFLTTSDNCADELYIINEADGDWDGETWFSNDSCQEKISTLGACNSYGKPMNELAAPINYDAWWNADDLDNDDWPDWDKPSEKELTGMGTPALSMVVRSEMCKLLINDQIEVLLAAAVEQGYCEFCLFSPCQCQNTCYYCCNRKSWCRCTGKDTATIGDMRLWIGDDIFQEVRRDEMEAEYEMLFPWADKEYTELELAKLEELGI